LVSAKDKVTHCQEIFCYHIKSVGGNRFATGVYGTGIALSYSNSCKMAPLAIQTQNRQQWCLQ